MKIVRRARVALAALVVLMWPAAADAQLSKVGAPFVTPGGASAYSRTTDTAYDSTHDVFLTAVTEHNSAPGGRVNASFANSDGTVLTSAFRLDSTGGFPFGPALAYSPQADVFLVVWVGGAGQVRGRLVRYGVNALGSAEFAVSGTGVAGGAWAPAVAYSPTSEEFLVAYSKGGTAVARVSTAGAIIGQPVTASIAIASGYHWTQDPALAWNPTNNQFLLTYAQELSPGWQIRAQRISSGQVVGGPTIVQTSGSTKMPDVQYSPPAGKYLVTWFQTSPYGIYGRMLNADASLTGSPQPMLPSNYGTYDANSLAYNEYSEKFAVASLTPQLVGGVNRDTIGGAAISSSGVPGTAMRFVEADSGNRFYPEIAASSTNNRFLTVFNKSHATFYGQMLAAGAGDSEPPPPPPGTLDLTGLTSSPTVPEPAGTTITWTAVATGSTTIEYQFWVYSGATGQWSVGRSWATSNTYAWTPSSAGQYAVQVWARLQGSADYQAESSGFFSITTASAATGTLTLTGLAASPAPPVAAGTTITWTGSATVSGSGTPEYQFWVYSAATAQWVVSRSWAPGNTFVWAPSSAGQYAVQVWARLQGTTAYQAKSSGFFTITSVVPPTGTLTLNGLAASPTPPVTPGTTITWIGLASVSGGGTAEYQFWVYSASTAQWVVGRAWATGNTFTWTPATAGTYAVQVWARLAGTTPYQYATSGFFAVSGTAAETTPVSLTSLSVSPGAPFGTGTPLTWSANATGAASIEYAFWVYSSVTQSWTMMRSYQGTTTFVWTPTSPGTYAVQVWARRVGSLLAYEDYESSGFFTVN